MRPWKSSDFFAAPGSAPVAQPATAELQIRTQTEASSSSAVTQERNAVINLGGAAVEKSTTTAQTAERRVIGGSGSAEAIIKKGHDGHTSRGHGEVHENHTTTGGTAKIDKGAAGVTEARAAVVQEKQAAVTLTGQATETVTTAVVDQAQSATKVEVAAVASPPASDVGTVPQQQANYKNWAETTMSYSPHDKSTVGTATVGRYFNEQNYGYVQGTADVTNRKTGDVSVMYGHTVLSPYDASGNARRGNVNVEAGVVIKNGPALEGSKIPVLGNNGVRLGVNGYYELDKEGKNTVYGGADYASSPKQADAQVGISHRFNDVTVSGGYQVSKVEGYRASQFATTSISMRLNDRAEVYTGAAISNHKEENRLYAGVRWRF
jgi:hypothetical protein